MDTKDAATIASVCKRENLSQHVANATSDTTGTVEIPGYNAQDVEDARRYLTLAALRWQARLDAYGVEVP